MNANPQWMPRPPRAIPAIDNLRSVVVLFVLGVHSLLPYFAFLPAKPYAFDAPPFLWRSFPLVDSQRLLGFDLFCAWVDIFVMALFFFLSGLFVWSSLARQGPGPFLRSRALRLGIPFATVVLLLMPIATGPTYLQTAAHPDVADFWRQFRALPFWPAGPVWFLWVLLAADVLAAALFRLFPRANQFVMQLSFAARAHPLKFAAGFLVAAAAGYVPLALIFGPLPWAQWGPFSIQLCRPLHYAVYFFGGMILGACGLEHSIFGPGGLLARHWRSALAAAVVCFCLWLLASAKVMLDPAAPLVWQVADAVAYVLACFASCCCALATVARFAPARTSVWNSLHRNGYGIYLLHYPFAVWLEFALLGVLVPAPFKAAAVFAATSALSWSATAALRRLPVFEFVIGTGRRSKPPMLPVTRPAVSLPD